MQGNINKPGKPGSGQLNAKTPTPAQPASLRPQPSPIKPAAAPFRPTAVPPRPAAAAGVVQRAASPIRAAEREVKRDALRQAVGQAQQAPRPAVAPPAPPQRVMPAAPPPAVIRARLAPTPPKPQGQVAGQIKPPAASAAQGGLFNKVQSAAAQAKPAAVQPPAVKPILPRPAPRPQAVPTGTGAVAKIAAAAAAVGVPVAVNVAAANAQISTEVSSLHSSLNDLYRLSAFTDVQNEVNNLDKSLTNVMNLLESARSKGYAYQRDLEEIAYQAVDQWQGVKPQVISACQQQAQHMQTRLAPLNSQVQILNMKLGNPAAATPLLSSTQTQVNSLLNEVRLAEGNLSNQYNPIESAVSTLNSRLTPIHWALGQLAEAKFKLESGENMVMAVAARWDQVGDDDPEGILYISDRRLIFERKEKVATKKVLFVTVSSQLVQEVMIDQAASKLQSVKAVNKGLFGHQDFIEVQFSDPKLGVVPFHLNGQDSKQWVTWIDALRTGTIANDRASGSGLSYADLTGPLTSGDIMALQTEVNALQDAVALTAVRQELAAVENDVTSLARKLADLRAKGYVIEKSLEADVTILATQWDRINSNAEKTIEQQTQLLNEPMRAVQQSLAQLVGMMGNLGAARPAYMQVKSQVASLAAQADASQAAVYALYDGYADEVQTLSNHFEWVNWMLEALATATFRLLATESGVAAAEAAWERAGMELENGILFLTDQRLLWEDRVGTFELELNIPLTQIGDVQKATSEDGQQEYLDFTFGSGAPYPTGRFALGMPIAESWLKMLGRARSGGYAQDRAVVLDPAEVERIRNAPQQCTGCGAALTAPILRGQTEVNCEYCGAVIRI